MVRCDLANIRIDTADGRGDCLKALIAHCESYDQGPQVEGDT